MAKKKEVIEEPIQEAVNGLKEINTEAQAAPVASAPVAEAPAVEEFNPHAVGHATRAFRG